MEIFKLAGEHMINKGGRIQRFGFIVDRARKLDYAVTCNFNILYNNQYNFDIRPVYRSAGKWVSSYIKPKNIIDLYSEEILEIPEVSNMIIKNQII